MYQERYFCSIIGKNRMLADLYIPRLSNDMQIAVQQNNQIFYRSLIPPKTMSVYFPFQW